MFSPPQHDHINFNNMPGNEIILNMVHVKYFSNAELVNSLYELTKRLRLKENSELQAHQWENHPYVGEVIATICKKFHNLNLNHVIVSSLSFDRLTLPENTKIWTMVEQAVEKFLHKLKPVQIILFLDLLNREPNRTSKEFANKMLTILPIHVNSLSDKSIITLVEICLNKDLVNERLFNYFIYPRIESRIHKYSLSNYIKMLKLLGRLNYQDDLVFWNEHILPNLFNYELNYEQTKDMWEIFIELKVNCPLLDISKYIILIENAIKQFENLKESEQDISNLLLKIEADLSLLPKIKKPLIQSKQIKELQRRLKDENVKNAFLRQIGADKGTQIGKEEAEASAIKMLDIKDWKKAKYDITLEEKEKILAERKKAEEGELAQPETSPDKLEEQTKPEVDKENQQNDKAAKEPKKIKKVSKEKKETVNK